MTDVDYEHETIEGQQVYPGDGHEVQAAAGDELAAPMTVEMSTPRENFETLYARLFPPMCRLAFVLVDTEEQAAEVVQDAFAKLYPRFDKVREPEAYVRASVLNLGRRALRRRIMARDRFRPEPEATANEHDHVIDAIRALPTRQRNAIVLRYYLQLTDVEIAATLGMQPGTVKSTLHRARAQLNEVLQP